MVEALLQSAVIYVPLAWIMLHVPREPRHGKLGSSLNYSSGIVLWSTDWARRLVAQKDIVLRLTVVKRTLSPTSLTILKTSINRSSRASTKCVSHGGVAAHRP